MNQKSIKTRVFKLKPSNVEDRLDISSIKYPNIEDYVDVLNKAKKEGVGYVIDGEEPTDKEIEEITDIYNRYGIVKVFRNKEKSH